MQFVCMHANVLCMCLVGERVRKRRGQGTCCRKFRLSRKSTSYICATLTDYYYYIINEWMVFCKYQIKIISKLQDDILQTLSLVEECESLKRNIHLNIQTQCKKLKCNLYPFSLNLNKKH